MEVFDKALQMSSGTRGTAKSGLGKYGQGLPNASISQTKRVEVYTYQNNKILFNHIDLDEIYKSGEAYLPDAESVSKIDIPLFKIGKIKGRVNNCNRYILGSANATLVTESAIGSDTVAHNTNIKQSNILNKVKKNKNFLAG